jgi:hypothetical protein
MMDPTPRDLVEEEQRYWERLYEGSLIEFLKRGWLVADATKHAADIADTSVKLRAERFSPK